MLASDLNNPDFANPQNPDSQLYVDFHWRRPIKKQYQNGYEETEWTPTQGSDPDPNKVVFITIMRPGDNTSILCQPARQDHKVRFPNHWLNFQQAEGMLEGGDQIPGTKIDEWDQINAEQKRDFKHMRFYTVEQVAGASDSQVQRLGLGGYGLREQARTWLKGRLDQTVRSEIAARDQTIAELQASVARLAAIVEQGVPSPVIPPQPDDVAQLRAAYTAKFGKEPHHLMKPATMKARLGA